MTSDIISTLPNNIIEKILTLMPIEDALRTSILSKKWRYSWRSMPKLVFTDNMVTVSSNLLCGGQLKKYKLASAIFHVLLFHNGPTILKFEFCCYQLQMDSEFDQIISYLARGNKVKKLCFIIKKNCYKLPISFFSLQKLEVIHLENCIFEPPLIFDKFSWLRKMKCMDVDVSAQMLERFLSKCPLLKHISLNRYKEGTDFVAGGNKFTFVDLLQCVPLIQDLEIADSYMKYLCPGGMPHKLPTSLVHLKYLCLDVCMTEQNEISFVLCMIRSSPLLGKLTLRMYDNEKSLVPQTSNNFLDPEAYLDLNLDHLEILDIDIYSNLPLVKDFVKLIIAKSPVLKKVRIELNDNSNFLDPEDNLNLTLDHLETLEIKMFSNLPLEMEFVKLIMAKSLMLKKVRIELNDNVSVDEEVKMLRDLVLLPFPRASPSAKLIIERPEAS
ncbi:putative F-box domain, FBD domain, leucine-rich repeat domain superfamily [Helianthus annuus]|nr:putative F-box domain, FBD domain, leucine-rich repeat domain superfamily [Helianthus annuus]